MKIYPVARPSPFCFFLPFQHYKHFSCSTNHYQGIIIPSGYSAIYNTTYKLFLNIFSFFKNMVGGKTTGKNMLIIHVENNRQIITDIEHNIIIQQKKRKVYNRKYNICFYYFTYFQFSSLLRFFTTKKWYAIIGRFGIGFTQTFVHTFIKGIRYKYNLFIFPSIFDLKVKSMKNSIEECKKKTGKIV